MRQQSYEAAFRQIKDLAGEGVVAGLNHDLRAMQARLVAILKTIGETVPIDRLKPRKE